MKTTKRFFVLILMVMMVVGIYPVTPTYAAPSIFTSLGENVIFPTSTTILLIDASKGDFEKIEHISLVNDTTKMSVSAEISTVIEGGKLNITINPLNNLEQNKKYTLKIFTQKNAFTLSLSTSQYVDFSKYEIKTRDVVVGYSNTANSKGPIRTKYSYRRIEIPANPAKGFYFPYFLEVPTAFTNEYSKYLMVIPNNTGYVNSAKYVEDVLEKDDYGNRIGLNVTGSLGMPLLIPTFPRPKDQFLYTHMLDEETLFMTKAISDKFKVGNLVSIDKQLVAMIADAKEQFKHNNVSLQSKIVMDGFSASSDFVHRFSMLYPEMIDIVIHQTTVPVMPLNSYKNTDLNFPIGIKDYKSKFGKDFNVSAYKAIKQFWYVGSEDHGNILSFMDGFNEKDRNIWANTFSPDGIERFEMFKTIYKDFSNIQFHQYMGIGHDVSEQMDIDFMNFIKANIGKSTLSKINATVNIN